MINIDEVTLKNNTMFNIVVSRPAICKRFIELVLEKKVSEIVYSEHEKTIDHFLEARSIRLDVYCEGEDAVYDIELQNGLFDNLPKRVRYYQGLIDSQHLGKSEDYSKLTESVIIFVCTFDLFGQNRHKYTFKNVCLEDESIQLGDCTTKIFLNTKGTLNDVSNSLLNFLNYIENGIVTDDFVQAVDTEVITARNNGKVRDKLMTLEEYADAKAKHERKIINELFQRLIEDGRLDEMLAATKDDELQNKLLKEYNLE